MKRSLTILLYLSSFFVAVPAMETDQYNLSPEPLADIAPEVEAYVGENIQAAVKALNAEIAAHEGCLADKTKGCSSANREQAKLAELRSDDAVAKAVYEKLGSGSIFITTTGKWLESHKFEHEPARYKAGFTESIYWERPVNYATLSPTIRMYGVEFGTDKLDHFFQQGYKYYTKLIRERAVGKDDIDAAKKAVAWGRKTENTYFGYLVAGVYSNADLYANYAGMRFYEGLTSDLKIADANKPATLKLVDGRWTVNTASGDALRPFVAEQLNEALNPSNYLPLLYPLIKGAVKKRACPEWRAAFPTATGDEINRRSSLLETWNGEDYGFKRTSHMVRVGDVCFADNKN